MLQMPNHVHHICNLIKIQGFCRKVNSNSSILFYRFHKNTSLVYSYLYSNLQKYDKAVSDAETLELHYLLNCLPATISFIEILTTNWMPYLENLFLQVYKETVCMTEPNDQAVSFGNWLVSD